MWYILDEFDNPVPADCLEAAAWMDNDKRIVQKTNVSKDVLLSTVFLCLDHSFSNKKPVLYESLWFGGPLDGNMRRYFHKRRSN